MLLNFDEMTPVPMEHFKGGVGTLQVRPYDDGNCKVLQMTLPQGTSIGLHTHEGSCEMIFVLSGEGICLDDGEEYPFRPGMCHSTAPRVTATASSTPAPSRSSCWAWSPTCKIKKKPCGRRASLYFCR